MRKALFFCTLIFLAQQANTQVNKEVRLVNGKKMLGKNFKKYKVGFTFDARNTFIGSTKTKLGGIKLGMYINRIHQIGIGIYRMNRPQSVIQIPNSAVEFYSAKAAFSYFSLFYERVLFFNKKWEWSSAIHIGSGKIKVSYVPYKYGEEIFLPNISTKPMEISSSLFHHLTYWFSVGGGVGYRQMRKTPEAYKPYFNGPIYLIKVKFRLFKLIKSAVNKEIKNEY